MNQLDLAKLVEFAEGSAHADMFRAVPPEFGFSVEESSDYVARSAPGMDVMLFNRVVGLGLNAPATKSRVHSLVQSYRDKGIKNFAIQPSPAAQPAELYDWLAEEGLSVRDYWTKASRGPDPDITIATDFRIEQIEASQAQVFGDTAATGFGMPQGLTPIIASPVGRPGWLHYIAWDNATPVAVAALLIRNGVGWLGIGATIPGYRQRGAQGGLIARRIRDGTRLGCKVFVAETWQDRPEKPNPSFHNMLRAGFVVAYERPNFMMPEEILARPDISK